MSGATFELTEDHYLPGDKYVEKGTKIGDGTDYPLWEGFRPSISMKPLNDAAQKLVDDEGEVFDPIDSLPLTVEGPIKAPPMVGTSGIGPPKLADSPKAVAPSGPVDPPKK